MANGVGWLGVGSETAPFERSPEWERVNATPESVEGGHLTEEGDGEEGNDREETSL